MTESNRHQLYWLTGAGLIVLTLTGWSVFSNLQSRDDRSQYDYIVSERPERLAAVVQECIAAEKARGSNTSDHEQRDLCAQYRAAVAAETSAAYAVAGFWLSLAGLVAVLFTLWVTGIQAQAAVKGNRMALLVGQNQTRAYVSVGNLRAPSEGLRVFVFPLTNSGSTPARGISWQYRLVLYSSSDRDPEKADSIDTDTASNPTHSELPGGGKPHEVSIIAPQAIWLRAKLNKVSPERPATFLINIRYRDVFDRCFELREMIDIHDRGDIEASDELLTGHVVSREHEISEGAYYLPIVLREPQREA